MHHNNFTFSHDCGKVHIGEVSCIWVSDACPAAVEQMSDDARLLLLKTPTAGCDILVAPHACRCLTQTTDPSSLCCLSSCLMLCTWLGGVCYNLLAVEMRSSVVVSTSAWHAARSGFDPRTRRIIRCKNLAIYIRDCISVFRRRL